MYEISFATFPALTIFPVKDESSDIVYGQIRFLFSLSINNGLSDETRGRILAEKRHCFILFGANIYDMSIRNIHRSCLRSCLGGHMPAGFYT